MEKKDILAYCTHRIEALEQEKAEIAEKVIPNKRERAIKTIEGRIRELKHLREVANNKKFREESKQHYQDKQRKTEADNQ